MRRRYLLGSIALVVIAGIWLWWAYGPWRKREAAPGRLMPLAAELEGVRGAYLYYGVAGTDTLRAEYRDVVVKDQPTDRIRAIFRELLTGPGPGLVNPFPDGVELLNTYMSRQGTLYLDWNSALVSGFRGGSGRERMLLSCIVWTAADNLPEVKRVGILIDGEPIETIGGHYDVLEPLAVGEWR